MPKMTDHAGRMTSRELLHDVAGDAHATHSVASARLEGRNLSFRCTCGITCVVAASEKHRVALRNVMGRA